MKEFTPKDVDRLREAMRELDELKQFVVQRAVVHAVLNGKSVNLSSRDGFVVEINPYDLLNPEAKSIQISRRDAQSNGPSLYAYSLPRDFLFATETPDEIEYKDFLRLKEKFEPSN